MGVEIIKIVPSMLWFLLASVLVMLFYKRIRDDLLPSLGGIKAGGIEFSFVKHSINSTIDLAEKSPLWKVKVPGRDRNNVLNRVQKHLVLFENAHILWIDDCPENNINERKMFHQLRVFVDCAKNTDEALESLKRTDYDLVVSDMYRDNDAGAGIQFLAKYHQQKNTVPVIFYVGIFEADRGVPVNAFGITNRPDELLHLILDILERRKY